MGLHPAERVREYRDKGYRTDDMIDALLRERVAQFGDITAITDTLNREALLDGPFRTLTWPQLDEQVSRLAQVLLAEGAGSGDVIGVQLPNTVEIVVAFLAIVRIGAIVAPFPVQYRAWELTHLSDVAQVKLFITASRSGAGQAVHHGEPDRTAARAARAAHRAAAERGAAGADRHLLAAHPRLGLGHCWRRACCRAGTTGTASRSSTSTAPTRASRCSARPMTSPTRRCARSTFPATAPGTGSSRWPAPRWRGSWTRRPAPRSRRRVSRASCGSRARACSPGYLPASGVPDPFDEDGYLRTGDILEIAGDDRQYLRYVNRSEDMVVRNYTGTGFAQWFGF